MLTFIFAFLFGVAVGRKGIVKLWDMTKRALKHGQEEVKAEKKVVKEEAGPAWERRD